MKPEAQRIAIAEACGWKDVIAYRSGVWGVPKTHGHSRYQVPDFLNDLNAMHEAEKTLNDEQILPYVREVAIRMHDSPEAFIGTIHATAAQRAEAFLRTIGKWEET